MTIPLTAARMLACGSSSSVRSPITPPRAFEYYLDAILFGRGVPELGRVMTADLAAYAAAGAHTVQALMTGTGSWRAPHPNPWLFSRLTWNPQQDAEALLHDWRAALAGFKGSQRI
jgi:hypothetical protein